jgi:FkbM family methyltransferase
VEPTFDTELFQTLDTRHGRLTVFSKDGGAVTKSLVKYGEWAENELNFLHAILQEGAHVLDVGAYIGTHTLAFARFVGPSGRVVSIEAQLPTFGLLKANVEANGLANITLIQGVASFEEGSVLIPSIDIDHEDSFGSASLLQVFQPKEHGHPGTSPVIAQSSAQVPAVTIDSLDLAQCALIKIDAEGMEDLVLRGAPETLQNCNPIIYAEVNSLDAGLRIFSLLKTAGYQAWAHVVDAFNLDNFRGDTENIFGSAREVALVGVPGVGSPLFEQYHPRSCELLLSIETADDLALALMNKPQYPGEVLYNSAAAKSGGRRTLDEAIALKIEVEKDRNDVTYLRNQIQQEAQRSAQETEADHQEIEHLKLELALEGAKSKAAWDEVHRITSELQRAGQEASAQSREIERLKRELAAANARSNAAREDLSRTELATEAKIEACMRQMTLVRQLSEQLQDSNRTLEQQASSAVTALEQVYASTSWRITAPVRAVSLVFGGRRKRHPH